MNIEQLIKVLKETAGVINSIVDSCQVKSGTRGFTTPARIREIDDDI